jgi:signal transduction histidine kinase
MTLIWRRASLRLKFLLVIIPLLMTTSLVVLYLFNIMTVKDASNELHDRIEKLVSIQSSSVADPLWSFDVPQIKVVIKAMLGDPDVRAISVEDENNDVIESVGNINDPTEPLLIIEKPLLHVDAAGAADRTIGTLRVGYSEARLRQESAARLRFTLLMASLMTVFAVIGSVIALSTAVIRPLATFLERIQSQRERKSVSPFIWNHADEVGVLAVAYNEMLQSQIAHENQITQMRDDLEHRVQERTQDLLVREGQLIVAKDQAEQALESLRTAQSRLVESERLASLGQLTAGIAHEIKNPLNIVNNFARISRELMSEMVKEIESDAANSGRPEPAAVKELAEMLTKNLSKIDEHGRRADSIVKNMLAHSRSDQSDIAKADPNQIVSEAISLVYHGLRAQSPNFNIAIDKALQPGLPTCMWYVQDVERAIMNIALNGMQAAVSKPVSDGAPHAPMIRIATAMDGADAIRIEIEDNGPGIPKDVATKIFEPFFTTKKPGEGTGLGLSMSYEAIVNLHGGSLSHAPADGGGTRFTISLPVNAGQTKRAKV